MNEKSKFDAMKLFIMLAFLIACGLGFVFKIQRDDYKTQLNNSGITPETRIKFLAQ